MNKFIIKKLPRVVRIEPSAVCNLRCRHCSTGTNPPRIDVGIMSPKLFDKILNEVKKAGSVNVVVLYHGGEPFLNKDLFKMIRAFKEIGIKFVKIVTNGMLIKESDLKSIIESGLDSIEFSIDGLSPEENNEIRVGSDYQKVLNTIIKLIKLKEKIKSSHPEIFIANTQIATEKIIKNNILIKPPKYISDDLVEFKDKFNFKCTYMIKWPGFNCGKEYKILGTPQSVKRLSNNECDNITETITIRANGDVVPCCFDIASQYVIGNIAEQTLEEIWNNKKYLILRKSIYERNYLPLCQNCPTIKPSLYVYKI